MSIISISRLEIELLYVGLYLCLSVQLDTLVRKTCENDEKRNG
jgi:hypothetical protein